MQLVQLAETPAPTEEYVRAASQAVQPAADCAEKVPAAQGVQTDGPLPEKPAALAKPPLR